MPNRIPKHRHSAFVHQAHQCFYCGCPMWEDAPQEFAARRGIPLELAELARCTAEHLKAKCEDGTDARRNIVAACLYCNQKRHRTPEPLDSTRYRRFVRDNIKHGRW